MRFEQRDLELVNRVWLLDRLADGDLLPWLAARFRLTDCKRRLLVAVHGVVILVQPLPQALEGQVAGGRPIRVVPLVPEGEADHVHQAVQVPTVERDGPGALVLLDLAVQPEGFRHRPGVPLQFTQFVAADEQAVAVVPGPRFHDGAPRCRR